MHSNGYALQIACCASCTSCNENSPSQRVTAAHHFQGSFSRSRSAFLSLAAVLDSRFPLPLGNFTIQCRARLQKRS